MDYEEGLHPHNHWRDDRRRQLGRNAIRFALDCRVDEMMWFVEERRACGRSWAPAVYRGDKPLATAPDKIVRFRDDPVPVPEFLQDQPLSVIAGCMARDGEFAMYGRDVHRNLVEYLNNPESFEMVIPCQ